MTASASNVQFENLTTEAGLSHAGITAITQDKHGFLWIGTQEGLNRYNGYEFETFTRDIRDSSTLGDDWVWTLLADLEGRLWVGTNNGGLSLYNETDGTFSSYTHDPEDATSIPANRVRTLFEDSENELWVGTSNGVARFDPASGEFSRYGIDKGLPGDHINVIYELEDVLLIGTDGGLAVFKRDSDRFEPYQVTQGVNVRSLSEYQGNLWIGTHDAGLMVLNPHTGSLTSYRQEDSKGALPGNLVRDLLVDQEGTLWVATDSGLAEWQPETGLFQNHLPDPADVYSLASAVVTRLFQDEGGVLWVGTYAGVSRWNYSSAAFYSLSTMTGHLEHDVVTALAEGEDGEVWVGSYGGGIDRMVVSRRGYYEPAPLEQLELADKRVMALAWDDRGRLWIGTRTGGLYAYTPGNGELMHFSHDEQDDSSISSNGITSLWSDEHSLWVGTYGGGLNRLDLDNPSDFVHFRHDPADDTSLGSDRVLAVYRDSVGHYWVGTEDGGLNRFNAIQGKFVRYLHDPEDERSLGNNTAWEIYETNDKALWVGTLGAGVSYWDNPEEPRADFERITTRDGLPSNTIYGVLEDPAGQIWISGNQGLAQFMPSSGMVRRFDRRNGIRGNEFNFGARIRTDNDLLLFGGTMGIVAFDPSNVGVNTHRPPVVIQASSNEIANVSSYSTDESSRQLELAYPDRTVRFSFAALDYASPDKNRYRYRLEGFDEEWIDAGQFRQANYTNLPSGSYLFKVIASNNDRYWNEEGASVVLTVVPPPWLSIWAYTLYAILILAVIVTYVSNQRRKLTQAAAVQVMLEKQVEERTQALNERNEQLQTANEQLRQASMSDPLTGLNNRRYLYEYLESQIATLNRLYARVEGQPDASEVIQKEGSLFFLMIDLDGFKSINDSYGHAAGDKALMQVRDVLRASTRESDIIIRWGGDEFLVLGHSEGGEGVKLLANRIRTSIADHDYILGDGNVGYLAASIGFAHYPFNLAEPKMFSWEQIVALADEAAYSSKRNGGNAWTTYIGTDATRQADVAMLKEKPEQVIESGTITVMSSVDGQDHS